MADDQAARGAASLAVPDGGTARAVAPSGGGPALPALSAPDPGLGRIAGLLLAAGTSSRMGANKLLLEIEGESLLRRAARRALEAGLSPLLVVLGHQAEVARGELAGLACEVVLNRRYAQGMGSSLQAGVAALPAAAGAAVVLLADMPLVTSEMLAALASRHRATRAHLVVSDYEGVRAPPMLYDRALFEELLAMPEGRCGREVAMRHRHEAEVLSWPAAAVTDLDRPEDFARLAAVQGGG